MVWVRLLNALVAALGDLVLLVAVFRGLRIRDPRLRGAAYAVALLHVVSAALMAAPFGLMSVTLSHDGLAPWVPVLEGMDPYVGAAWLGGAAVLLASWGWRVVVGRAVLDRLGSLPAGSRDPAARVALLAGRMGMCPPAVLTVPGRTSPFVSGWLKPRLVLPVGLLSHLREAEIDAVVAHELAHVRAGDTRLLAVLDVFDRVFWPLPAVAWLTRGLRVELEKARDLEAYRATGSRRALAAGLLKVRAWCREADSFPPALAAFLPLGRDLTIRRLAGLLGPETPPFRRRLQGAALLLAFALLAAGQGRNPVRFIRVPGMETPGGHHAVFCVGLMWKGPANVWNP